MFRGIREIRDSYRVETVARQYIEERFRQPLGALLHDRQAGLLRRMIAQHHPRSVLEVAPGPARLTTEVAGSFTGIGAFVDASEPMLRQAMQRLPPSSGWHPVQGDAFALPFRGQFDLVYTFRLVRHFDTDDRSALYRQFERVLRPGGLLIFDAVNEAVSRPLRQANPEGHTHFDALFERGALIRELDEHGFEILSVEGVHRRYAFQHRIQVLVAPRSARVARLLMEACERVPGGQPLEWIVVCRRRP